MPGTRVGFVVLAVAVTCCLYGASGQELKQVRRSAVMMTTDVQAIVCCEDEKKADEAISAAFVRMEAVGKKLDRYQPDSEVSLCNREAAKHPVKVSPELFEVLRRSKEASARTEGAFDITVTPLIILWKDCAKRNTLPTAEELQRARDCVGADKLILDEKEMTVRFAKEGVLLDLGGDAKGYIVDQGIKVLREKGIRGGLIEAGGDMYAMGTQANGDKWSIGITNPLHPDDEAQLVTRIEVCDRAVSTSGNYRRFVEIAGKHYSHIIDPRTAQPVDSVPSVTIVGLDTTTTDTLSTGLTVMGVEKGLALAEKLDGIATLMITVDGTDLKLHASSRFGQYLEPGQPEIAPESGRK